jgi:hypothetical protein
VQFPFDVLLPIVSMASAKSTVFAGGMFSVGIYKTSLSRES